MTFLHGITWGVCVGLVMEEPHPWVVMLLVVTLMGLGWGSWVALRVKPGRIGQHDRPQLGTDGLVSDQEVVDSYNRWLAARGMKPLSRKEVFFLEWGYSTATAVATASLVYVLFG